MTISSVTYTTLPSLGQGKRLGSAPGALFPVFIEAICIPCHPVKNPLSGDCYWNMAVLFAVLQTRHNKTISRDTWAQLLAFAKVLLPIKDTLVEAAEKDIYTCQQVVAECVKQLCR
ncbi:hypothetical protein ACP4OV_026749 [Aristida adscensionis]